MGGNPRMERNEMELTRNGKPRVVITGMGALTPLGEVVEFWEGLLKGKSGVRYITMFDPDDLGVQIAGEVDFYPKEQLSRKTQH